MPLAGTHEARAAHQARDPFAAVSLAALAQIGMHPRCAVGLAGAGVHRPRAREQCRVGQ